MKTFHHHEHRVKCDRSSIYKNVCLNLIVAELLLVLIVYRPPLEDIPIFSFCMSLIMHLLILNIFMWTLMDSLRVYCLSIRASASSSCDTSSSSSPASLSPLSRILFSCFKHIFSSSSPHSSPHSAKSSSGILLYLTSYGIPLMSVTLIAVVCPEAYTHSTSHYMWIRLDRFSAGSWFLMYSPAIASVSLAIIVLTLSFVSVKGHHHHRLHHLHPHLRPSSGISNSSSGSSNCSNGYKDQNNFASSVPSVIVRNPVAFYFTPGCLMYPLVLLVLQIPTWILANMFFFPKNSLTSTPPSLFLTSSFTVINMMQSVILFVMSLSRGKHEEARYGHHRDLASSSGTSSGSSFTLSKVSSFFVPDCILRVMGSSPSKSVSSSFSSHPLHLHQTYHHQHQLHHSLHHLHHLNHASSTGSTYNISSPSSPLAVPVTSSTGYSFYPLDPNRLPVPTPPSPLIPRSSTLNHVRHHQHNNHQAMQQQQLINMVKESNIINSSSGASSSNSSGGSTSTTGPSVMSNGQFVVRNLASSSTGTTTAATTGRNNRNSALIQDVNPYAAPVSVTGHEYEDISTAMMRDVGPYSMTLALNSAQANKSSHQNVNHHHHRNSHHLTMNPRIQQNNNSSNNYSHYRQENRADPDPTASGLVDDTLYYEEIPPEASSVITPSSSVIYGPRNNGLSLGPNYVFHNTR